MKKIVCLIFIHCCFFMLKAQNVEDVVKQKPVTLSGLIDARTIAYSANGIAARRQPFSWILSGTPTLTLYGFSIPFSFSISEQDRNFSQPFNQFGLSPTYKWLTIHAGYRNLSFSPYTLDGYTMLGAGVELKPKGFSLAVMHGRLNRATTVDTTLGTLQPFSFSRKGTAVKLAMGDEKNHVTISALKAADDSNSVKVDAALKYKVRAAANTVGSISFRQEFAKKVFVEGAAAASVYTADMGSNLKFTDSSGNIQKLEKIISVNGTTEFSTAYTGAFGVKLKNFSIKAEYKNISPNFQSMGVYFFNTDIESYTLNPTFNIGNNFQFSGSIGKQKDNVKQQKEATTERWIAMGSFNWNITQKFGVDGNFSNFSSNSKPTVVLVQNKYLFAQNNNNISITPRYIHSTTKGSHVILLSYNSAALVDRNDVTQTQNNINTNIYLLTYSYSITKSATTITTAINKTTNKLSIGTFENMGFTTAINKSWLKGKLMNALSATYTNSKSIVAESNIINASFNAAYIPAKKHKISFRYALLSNNPKDTNTQTIYTENTAEIGYTYQF